VQDYAIPLFYLWHHEHGAELWDAYAEGYSSVRGGEPAERSVLCDLIAARQVDLIAFVLKTNLLGTEAITPVARACGPSPSRLEALSSRSA
jgi:Ser/Thr protein kinase RdoA (MazF antagonist)